MTRAFALGATLLLLGPGLALRAAPAAAQVYPGEEVTVNPGALGHGYLLYPGGKYGRSVGHLLLPGERPGGAIHLHMPVKHKHVAVARRPKAVAAAAPDATPAPDAGGSLSYNDPSAPLTVPDATPAAPVRHKPAKQPPRKVAAAPPPPPAATTPPPTADISSMPEDSAARLVGADGAVGPAPKPHRTVSGPPPAAASPFEGAIAPTPAKPRRVANAAPAPNAMPPGAVAAGLRKQSVIAFAPGASSPAVSDVTAVHALAGTLNAALNSGAGRVQLDAYGGPRGDKSSDSRRLSLKRALVIRELLIEDGVPAEKIDVRALGGADDDGPADRVDVFVHA